VLKEDYPEGQLSRKERLKRVALSDRASTPDIPEHRKAGSDVAVRLNRNVLFPDFTLVDVKGSTVSPQLTELFLNDSIEAALAAMVLEDDCVEREYCQKFNNDLVLFAMRSLIYLHLASKYRRMRFRANPRYGKAPRTSVEIEGVFMCYSSHSALPKRFAEQIVQATTVPTRSATPPSRPESAIE
ncbi:MAG: hypothetical protein M1835_007693, partial [Candelina submexicana]